MVVKLTGIFSEACSALLATSLAVIPADFNLETEKQSTRAMATVGNINAQSADVLVNYLTTVAPSEQSPDLLAFGSNGGEIPAARRIIQAMEGRFEVAYVFQAESAATAIISYADNVYATEDAVFMFHQARLKRDALQKIHPQIPLDLETITGKADDFVQSDFRQLHNTLLAIPNASQSYIEFARRTIELLEADNNFLKTAYQAKHPHLNNQCAEAITAEQDLFLDAEQMLALGFVDAVLINQGGNMLVRDDDPRATKFKDDHPDQYVTTNPTFRPQ